ncbi:hypothetical protein AGMMS4952_04510 [Spirochaetia bacterium]|nr:hypothetical protein AGMMS4952_04510 [Spirochaetia bacterium]
MCPDPQMLSLYYDGELPSPWREKLEAHLAACPSCRDRLEQFRLLSGTLVDGPSPGLPLLKEQVWQRISNPAAPAWKIPAPKRSRVWNRSIPVPLPVAIAAAAMMILAFGIFFTRGGRTVSPVDSALAALGMQTMSPDSDFNALLQYWGNDDSPDIMIIRLPESRSFMSSGEPAIIRAADYSGAGGLKLKSTEPQFQGSP